MSRSWTRRVPTACALPAALAAVLVAAGAASADPGGEQCAGEEIGGKGASLQELAQIAVWAPEFKNAANGNLLACNGNHGAKKVINVVYTSTGSGAGLRSWGQEPKAATEVSYAPTNAYIGTDEPPNVLQKEEMEKHSSMFVAKTSKLLQTIPVLQAAVTIPIHLPKGCTSVEKGAIEGRIGLSLDTVEDIFAGQIVAWKSALNGSKLLPKGCNEEKKEGKTVEKEQIKRVVREDGSGTTSIVKKFFDAVNAKKEIETGKTWKALAESANNTKWPVEGTDPVLRGAKNSGVANKVSETPSTFGYVNLADVRVNGKFTEGNGGGPKKASFWIELENGAKSFADPSTNGPAGAKAKSNCSETKYSNGKKLFPPKSTNEPWFEVTTELKEPNYPLCGFTYDLGLEHNKSFKSEPPNAEPSEGSIRSAFDYLNFVTSEAAGGGQPLIGAEQDYLGLPVAIDKIASEGVHRISD